MAIKTGYVPYPACVVPADRVTGLTYSNYGMVHAKDIIGSRSVPDLPTLYQLSAGLLSEDGEGANAVGQLWYVASEKAYYTLTDWSKKDTSAGWTKGIPGVSGESSGGSIVDTNTTYAFSPTTKDNTIGFEVTPSEGDPITVELGTFATINNKSILGGGNITIPTGPSVSVSPITNTGTNIANITIGNKTYSLFAPSATGGSAVDTNTTYTFGDGKVDNNTISIPITEKNIGGNPASKDITIGTFATINSKSILGGGNISTPDTNTTYAFNSTTKDNTIGFRVTPSEGDPIPVSLGTLATINGKPILDGGNIATPDTNTTYSIGAAKTTDENTIGVTLTGSDGNNTDTSWGFKTINGSPVIGSGDINIPTGPSISITRSLTEGTPIATITLDGDAIVLYAPKAATSGGTAVDTNTTYAFNSTTKDNTIGFRVIPSEGDPIPVSLGTLATINSKSILDGGNITTPDTNTTYSIGAAKTTDDNTIKVTLTGSDKVTSSAGWEFRTINKNSIIGSGNITIPDTNTTYTFGDGKVDNNTISIPITEKNIGGNPASKDITIGTFATINSKSILGGGNITTPDTNTTYSIGAAKTTDENTIGVTLTGSDGNNTDTSWGFKTINGSPVIGSGDINIPTGPSISITRSLTEGTPIATITLDGDAIVLYAPKAATSGGTAVDTNTTYAFNSTTKDNTIGFRVIPSEGDPIPVSLGTLATINSKSILDGGNITTPDTNTTYSIGAAKTTDDNTIKVTLTGSDKVTSSAGWEFRTINKNSIIGSGNITIPDTNTTYTFGDGKVDNNTISIPITEKNIGGNPASKDITIGTFATINSKSILDGGNITTPDTNTTYAFNSTTKDNTIGFRVIPSEGDPIPVSLGTLATINSKSILDGGNITTPDTNTTYAFNSTTKDNTIGFRVIPSEGDPIPVSLGTLATINSKSILDGGNITTPDTNTTYSIGAAKTTDDNTIKVTLTGSDKVTSSAGWEFRTINKNSIIGSGNITIPDTNTTYSIGAAKTTDENTIGVTLTDSNNVASSVGWEFKTINGNSVIGSGNIAISTPDQVVKKVENTGSGTVVESVKLSNGTLTVTNRAESPITITDAGPTEIATVGDVNVLTAIKASGHAITKTSRTIVLPGAIPDKDITNIIAPTAAASYGFHGGPASDLKPMCVTPCSPVIYKITKGSSTMKEGEYYLLDTSNGYFYECWSPGINGANAIRQGDRIDRTTSDSSLTSELAFMVVGDPTLGNPVKLVKLY